MKRIYFNLPVDEDTNIVIQLTVENFHKAKDDSINADVTMEQLLEFRDLLDEIIEDLDKSSWL